MRIKSDYECQSEYSNAIFDWRQAHGFDKWPSRSEMAEMRERIGCIELPSGNVTAK